MGLWDSIRKPLIISLWDSISETWEEVKEESNDPKLARGSVLRVELDSMKLVNFDHFGIYAGNKEVIHFSKKKIRKEHLSKFVEGTSLFNGDYIDVMTFPTTSTNQTSLEESYQRAVSCLGMVGYNLLDANCEHFALWCRTGEAFSGQALGSNSTLFPQGAGALNIPRLVGKAYNKLGMQKGRSICFKDIVDI